MHCFETAIERARVAQEVMEHAYLESEVKGATADGQVEVISQKLLSWAVKDVGAYCTLRAYSHRHVIVEGEQLWTPTPFFYMYLQYRRSDGQRATGYIDFTESFAYLKNSSPQPDYIWDEAMGVCDESLRDMHSRTYADISQRAGVLALVATIA